MPFTQVRYLNGGGTESQTLPDPAPTRPAGGTGLSDPARYALKGPWRWLAWPQMQNQQHLITDLDILGMDPADAVALYYDLNQYKKTGTGGLTYHWEGLPLAVVSDGLTPAEAEAYERGLRDRIFLLRGDLHAITMPDGSKVDGLVDLSKIRTIPEVGLTTGGQVFKWAVVIASSVATAGAGTAISLGLLVENLTLAGLKLSSDLRAQHDRLELVDRIVSGAYAIIGKKFRDELVKAGVNLRPYEDAVNIETSTLAWELALSIGLPHPAMICTSQADSFACGPGVHPYAFCGRTWAATEICTPAAQEYFLTGVLNWVKDRFQLENRRAVEDAVRFNGKWQLKNSLQIFSRGGVNRLMAIVPAVFAVNGRVMLQDGLTGQYIDPESEPELAPVLTWLQIQNTPDIVKPAGGAGVGFSRVVRGATPPADVVADMARALPLAPPLLFGGTPSTLPAPIHDALPPVEALPPVVPVSKPPATQPATLPAAIPPAPPSAVAAAGAAPGGLLLAGQGNSWLLIGGAILAAFLFAGQKRKK